MEHLQEWADATIPDTAEEKLCEDRHFYVKFNTRVRGTREPHPQLALRRQTWPTLLLLEMNHKEHLQQEVILFRTELQQLCGVSMSSTKEPVCDTRRNDFSSLSSSSSSSLYCLGCLERESACYIMYECIDYIVSYINMTFTLTA